MAMELLQEPAGVSPDENTSARTSVNCGRSVNSVEGGNDKHQSGVSEQKISPVQRFLRNIDPLFYITWCLSIIVLAGGLLFLLQRSESHIEAHLRELTASNAELAAGIADREAGAPPPEIDTHVNTDDLSDPVVQLQTLPGDTGTDAPGATIRIDKLETVDGALTGGSDNNAAELADLKLLLLEKTQQIELLALENHELRLLVEFGSAGVSDLSLDSVADEAENNNHPSVTTEPSADNESKSRLDNVSRLVANGDSAYTGGDYPDARDWYDRAVQLDPFNRDANLGVASAAIALGQNNLAVDRYRHLLTLNADDAEAFSAMLALSATSGMIETELLAHITTKADQPALLYSIAGQYYGQAGRWQEANAMFAGCLASAGDMTPADCYFNLAVSFEHTAMPDKALEYYLQALNTHTGATFEPEVVQRRIRALTR